MNASADSIAWLEGIFLGIVATTVGILAIASVGFLLVTGRIVVRRAAQVVFGCFIIFSAPAVASGIHSMIQGSGPDAELAQAAAQPPALPQSAANLQGNSTPYAPTPEPPYRHADPSGLNVEISRELRLESVPT